MSDVLIISYGSFGNFGAFLGKQKLQVFYPKKHKANEDNGINLGLPRFTPISWQLLNKTTEQKQFMIKF